MIPSSRAYFSLHTNSQGKRVCTIIAYGSLPLMVDGSVEDAMLLAHQIYGTVYLDIWDGDLGQFVRKFEKE